MTIEQPNETNSDQAYAFLLVSPREPSGVSWIINCLLELGIRVDLQPTADQLFGVGRQSAAAIWVPETNGRWRLHPRASALRKWLPILSRSETLYFRPFPRVLHVQTLPGREERQCPVILFVRDLRDALHSLYRRMQPQLTWQEFITWPHSETLLDAIDYWRLFIECWLARQPVSLGRFEDYKADARLLLGQVLKAMQIECSAEDIASATERSSYAAAAAAEANYRQTHPHDQQVVNRAGTVGEWEKLPDVQPAAVEIERRAGHLLTRLGYRTIEQTGDADRWDQLAITPQNVLSEKFDIPAPVRQAIPDVPQEADIRRLEEFAARLTVGKLSGSPFDAEEIRTLLCHLEDFSHRYAPALTPKLQALKASFADGSNFHLARIRELFLSRQVAPES